MALSSSAFEGAVWALAVVYVAVFLWSMWKLAVFSSVSWAWTGQKTIHACTALAAAGAHSAELSPMGSVRPALGAPFF